ncbi:MAG TPA: FkbM family methyltransferase [Burkholderiales bacterium]|nr:FkbM family methyltransferase [Burkholderiales bacterium]
MIALSHASTVWHTVRPNLAWRRHSPARFAEVEDHRPLDLRLRNGRSVSLCGAVRAALNEIVLHRIYDVPGVVFRQCRQVFDLGADLGVFAAYIASESPHARIDCFEASGRAFPLLQRNLAANTRHARAHRMAVAATCGQQRVAVTSDAYRSDDDIGDETETVECTDLANAFVLTGVDTCDFLKMDMAGEEAAILQKTAFDVLRRVRVMALKWNYAEEELPRTRLHLAAAGFKTMADYVGPGRRQIMLKAWQT